MAKNQPIGSCPCPVADCAASCQVFRFRSQHTKDTQRRYAGKLYIICREHGRLGMDGREAMQDFILKNAKLDGPRDHEPAPAPAPAPPAAKPVSAPPAAPPPPAPPSSKPATPTPRRSSADFDW